MSAWKFIRTSVFSTDEKTNVMRRHITAMLCIKGGSLLASLLYVPLMLHAVTNHEYGILLTLTSMIQWVSMMDIGLGNGLRNRLVEYRSFGDDEASITAISSCYAVLTLYVGVICVAFLICSGIVNWCSVFNTIQVENSTLTKLVNIVFLAFSGQLVLNLINPILYAFQLPSFTSIIVLVSQLLSLLSVWLIAFVFDNHSLVVIGASVSFVPLLVLAVSSIILYSTKLQCVRPKIRNIQFKSVNPILSLGIKFFILQIITIVIFQANNIIIAQAINQETVVEYNIIYKYISILSMIFIIIMTPVWSAVTDAYVKNDFEWIRKIVRILKLLFAFVVVGGALMVLISPKVYDIWVGDSVEISIMDTSLMLVFILFEILYRMYGTIINGIGKLNAQLLFTSVIATIFVFLALFWGKRSGLSGVLAANIVTQVLNYLWSRKQYCLLINRKAQGIWNK